MSASDPAMISAPARPRRDDSRRGSVAAGATKRTKKAVPRPSATPAYERARPAISRALGGGAAAGAGGGGGNGTFPPAEGETPLVGGSPAAPVAGHPHREP